MSNLVKQHQIDPSNPTITSTILYCKLLLVSSQRNPFASKKYIISFNLGHHEQEHSSWWQQLSYFSFFLLFLCRKGFFDGKLSPNVQFEARFIKIPFTSHIGHKGFVLFLCTFDGSKNNSLTILRTFVVSLVLH
jgi:hypothetical protein